jgi:hypothetical protein
MVCSFLFRSINDLISFAGLAPIDWEHGLARYTNSIVERVGANLFKMESEFRSLTERERRELNETGGGDG